MDVLDLPWSRPLQDCFDLVGRHGEPFRREDVPEILDSVRMELAFVGASIEAVLSEASEHFANVSFVVFQVIGVNEDVVEVDDDRDVEKVLEDVVHEALKSGRRIG